MAGILAVPALVFTYAGNGGHASVADALLAWLSAARAQLDKQVEVRMKQAAQARSASRGRAIGAFGGAGSRADEPGGAEGAARVWGSSIFASVRGA